MRNENSKPTKRENEVSEGIHKIERYLEDRYRSSQIMASVHLDPEMYYNDRGWPSRFLSIHYPNNSSEIRLILQRNSGHGVTHSWTLGQSTYVNNILIYEMEKDFHNLPNIMRHLRDNYLGEESASAWIHYAGKTSRIHNIRPPTVDELLGLDINPRDANKFIVGTLVSGTTGVYDRSLLLINSRK